MPNDLRDLNNFEGQLRSQLEKVREMDSQADAAAIGAWVGGMSVAASTKVDRLVCIRKLAGAADVPLTELETKTAVVETLEDISSGRAPNVKDEGLASGTMRQYRQATRLFFRDELDYDWAEGIEIGAAESSPIGPEDILSSDEMDRLLAAATTPRDKAMIAFLAVTGQRITATLSIRRRDVDLSDDVGTVRLNDEALGLKGADGPRPLLWARSHVANWMAVHPRPDDPEAPLFCALNSGCNGHGGGDGGTVSWERGDPLTRTQAARRLKNVAQEAGVPTEKVSPHNFRHTAITRMRDQDMHDDRIRFMVGVAPESDILERYDHATNEEMIRRVREHHGIEQGEEIATPTIEQCPMCGAQVRNSDSYCAGCGNPLSMQAAEQRDEVEDDVIDRMAEADEATRRQALKMALEDARDDPAVLDALIESLDHGSSPKRRR